LAFLALVEQWPVSGEYLSDALSNAQITGESTSFSCLINQEGIGSSRQLLAGKEERKSRLSFEVNEVN
jgi:hypothetical protein